MYKLVLHPNGHPAGAVQTLSLGGDFVFVPGNFNTNGMEALPNGSPLIMVKVDR